MTEPSGLPRPQPSRRSVLRAVGLAGAAAVGSGIVAASRSSAAGSSSLRVVDPAANQAALDLAQTLDGFSAAGSMAVGQQLNVNSGEPFAPLTALDAEAPPLSTRVRLLGWVTNEWDYAVRHGYNDEVLPDLAARAQAGTVLVASWYPRNPRTGLEAQVRVGPKVVDRVVTKGTPERKAFLTDFDKRVAPYLLQLQEAGVATIFRPLVEANSYWFWWGCDNSRGGSTAWRTNLARLYRLVQQRARAHGIHNVLWCYSFVSKSEYRAGDPVAVRPAAYDIAGLSSYDFEARGDDDDELVLGSYNAMAAVSPRIALAEVGPLNSNGSWNPAVITSGLQAAGDTPAYCMFWFDDGEPDLTNTDGSAIAGKKQISSLTGGKDWLATATPDGLIPLGS